MRVYDVVIIISGNCDKPEQRQERVLASGWQDVCDIMSAVSRDTGCVIKAMNIVESKSSPFDYKTMKAMDT